MANHVQRGGRYKPITDDMLPAIQEMAAHGLWDREIAQSIGMSPTTFIERKKESPALQAALDAGRAIEHQQLHNALHTAAMNGNIVAAIFLLKTRHGYREQDSARDVASQVVINLPGALPLDQFTKTIKP
jgi:hypothetical protein